MDTPDGYKSEEADAEPTAGIKPLLRTTTWGGHQPGAFERVLWKINTALRPLIAAHLTDEHALLFAEPVTDAGTGEVHWYSPVEGEAVSYVDLTSEDQEALEKHVNQLLFDLLELARKLQAEPKSLEDYVAGQLLGLQLDASYSEKECLYVVGFQPVFAFWAFESGSTPDVFAPAAAVNVKRERAAAPGRGGAAAAATPGVALEQRRRLPRAAWTRRQWVLRVGIFAVVFAVGLSVRETVVSWLDRVETLRAREQALLRIIARNEKARTAAVTEAEIEAEIGAGAGGVVASDETADVLEEFAEPMPPFEGARGKLPIEKLQGTILLMHFWSAGDPEICGEITSFVSMVTSERFDPLRELGGEAYLITNEESVEKGNERLKVCGVQDPFLLRDPEGAILRSIAPDAKPPVTVVFDRLTERTLKTYSRRDWLDPAIVEELQNLFLMQTF